MKYLKKPRNIGYLQRYVVLDKSFARVGKGLRRQSSGVIFSSSRGTSRFLSNPFRGLAILYLNGTRVIGLEYELNLS